MVESLEEQIDKNKLGYLMCLNASSISFDEFPDSITGTNQLAWVTADSLLKRLNYDLYQLNYSLSDNKQFLDSYFVTYFEALSGQFTQLLNYSIINISTIKEYTNVLRRKKVTSKNTNKWGDCDDSEWKNILNEFAREKLMASAFMSFTESMPDHIKQHAKMCDIDDLYGRFVNSVFSAEVDTGSDFSSEITTGEDFEIYIKRLLELKIPEATIETTPRTGDNGADLLVFANGYTIAIQAKFYTSNVGNSAVQEIFSAKSLYKADFAVVVTNSNYTKPAQDAASELQVVLATDNNIVDVVRYLIE